MDLKSKGYWRDAAREVLRRPRGFISLGVIAVYLAVALWGISGWRLPDWQRVDFSNSYHPPCAAHWFGTDIYGRDVLAKTVYGTRTALSVALIASGLAVLIGVTMGMLAGFFGGVIDDLISWLYSTLQTFRIFC